MQNENVSRIDRHVMLSLLCALALVSPARAGEDSEFKTLDLSALFNADIVTHADNRTDGQVDGGRASFPAEPLPKSGAAFKTCGIDFLFPSKEDGERNAIRCEGQTIPVEGATGAYLYLLATAADGNQRTTLRMTHEDGAVIDAALDVNDWCAENPGLGGVHGVVSDYRHTLGGPQTCKTSIWMVPVRLRSKSPLVSVVLPNNPNVFVIAATLGPAGEERRLQTYIKDAFLPSAERGIDRLVLLEIVEPESNATLRLLAGDSGAGDPREIASFPLKPGTQSIPVWLPVMKQRTYFFDIEGERKASLDETNLFENTPKTLFRVAATAPVHPSDAGAGMAPAWEIPALPRTDLRVTVHLPDCPAEEMTLRAIVAPLSDGGACRILQTNLPFASGRAASAMAAIDPGDLVPGDYSLDIALLLDGFAVAQDRYILTIVDPAELDRPFGARETHLGYKGPVWTNWDAAISYDRAWQDPVSADIVVDYPGMPYRYVFWKGMSYCPVWMFDRTFVSLEWMEAWPRQDGAVDCVEPLQDKECKYSKVALLSSTPARARVRWDYAETDFELKVIHGETAQEIYTMYPDGIAVRKVTGRVQKGRWHEVNEFIVGSVAGTIPSEHMPAQTFSLLNCSGGRLDFHWPTPQDSDLPVWEEYIGVVHLKNNPSVFLACTGRETGLHIYSNNPDWLPEVFFCMPHWPLQRGLPTTNARSIGECRNRATHASLVNIYAGPYARFQDHTIWALLMGIAPEDEKELTDLVRGWLYPPELEVLSEPALASRYDLFERGYVIDLDGEESCTLRIGADDAGVLVRPAFVLNRAGAPTACAVALNGETLNVGTDFTWGAEPDDDRVVVWLNQTLNAKTIVDIVLARGDETTSNVGHPMSPIERERE